MWCRGGEPRAVRKFHRGLTRGTGGSEDPEMCRQGRGVQGESVGQRMQPIPSTEPAPPGLGGPAGLGGHHRTLSGKEGLEEAQSPVHAYSATSVVSNSS